MLKEFECSPPSSPPPLLNLNNKSPFGSSTLEVPEIENISISTSDSSGTSSSESSTLDEPEIADISSSSSAEIISPLSTSEKNSSTAVRSCKCEKNKIDDLCI